MRILNRNFGIGRILVLITVNVVLLAGCQTNSDPQIIVTPTELVQPVATTLAVEVSPSTPSVTQQASNDGSVIGKWYVVAFPIPLSSERVSERLTKAGVYFAQLFTKLSQQRSALGIEFFTDGSALLTGYEQSTNNDRVLHKFLGGQTFTYTAPIRELFVVEQTTGQALKRFSVEVVNENLMTLAANEEGIVLARDASFTLPIDWGATRSPQTPFIGLWSLSVVTYGGRAIPTRNAAQIALQATTQAQGNSMRSNNPADQYQAELSIYDDQSAAIFFPNLATGFYGVYQQTEGSILEIRLQPSFPLILQETAQSDKGILKCELSANVSNPEIKCRSISTEFVGSPTN